MKSKYNNGEPLPVKIRVQIYEQLLCKYGYELQCEGFCFSVSPLLQKYLNVNRSVYIDDHKYLLPELYKFRTYRTLADSIKDQNKGYWYRNNKERITALERAIKLLTTK